MISSFIPSFLLGWGKRGLEQDPFQPLCLWFLQQWPAPGQSVNRRAIETASWCWHPCETIVRPCQTGQDVGKMLGSFVPTCGTHYLEELLTWQFESRTSWCHIPIMRNGQTRVMQDVGVSVASTGREFHHCRAPQWDHCAGYNTSCRQPHEVSCNRLCWY